MWRPVELAAHGDSDGAGEPAAGGSADGVGVPVVQLTAPDRPVLLLDGAINIAGEFVIGTIECPVTE